MALVFDSLGYSRKLREAGLDAQIAEAAADAAREHIMLELVTRDDLQVSLDNLALRLTVRMGFMIAAGLSLAVAILGALIKFH
jgi:hypothetical protein